MLIQRGGWNLIGLGRDGECKTVLGLPYIHGLKEQHTSRERSTADPANAFLRQSCFHWVREPNTAGP